MEHRESFIIGLSLIAEAIEEMAGRGLRRPILAGGAAVELWTSSEIVTGDFVTENQAAFEEMERVGDYAHPHL